MGDTHEVSFRCGPIARAAAFVLIAVAVAATVASAIEPGWSFPGVLALAICLVAFAVVVLRLEVATTANALVINGGVRRRAIAWDQIRAVRATASAGGRRVVVELLDGRRIGLPVAKGFFGWTRRREVERVAEALERRRLGESAQ